MKPYFIGISGGSGSGKTYLIKQLIGELKDEISVFSLDNYYLPYDDQPFDQNKKRNFDTPESFDLSRLFGDLENLKSGKTISLEEYNFNFRDRLRKTIEIHPTKILIIEGLFTFYFEEIKRLLDLKIYVKAPDYLMLKRRILRDNAERGYNDLQETLYRYEHHVMPAYHQYISPFESEADIIIPNIHELENSVNVLKSYIKDKLGDD